jgi:methionyl aminopeptidase
MLSANRLMIVPTVDQAPSCDSENDGICTPLDPNADPSTAVAKKKKKRNKKKSLEAPAAALPPFSIPAQDNSCFRLVGNWKAQAASLQSDPPTQPVRHFPLGEIHDYRSNPARYSTTEAKEKDKVQETDYNNIRRAAECHRNVRKYAQSYIRPGMAMIDICQKLEAKTLELIEANGLASGFGFPTGCSLNHVAAHYSPNYGDKTVLQYGDICKLDFGVHVAGRIVDCAFTIAFDPKFDNLIQATKDATNMGLRTAGIDVRFGEVSEAIQEVIESFEMEINGKSVPIKAIRNLNGHTMEPYRIHAGKSLPIVKGADCEDEKMEEGEFYAIETFATTGKGYVVEDMECSHYMKNYESSKTPVVRTAAPRQLLQHIEQTFGTLPFCRRWLDDQGQQRHLMALKALVELDIINAYPPLCEIKGAFTSQMEHTLLLRPTCKEIVSRGDDY